MVTPAGIVPSASAAPLAPAEPEGEGVDEDAVPGRHLDIGK